MKSRAKANAPPQPSFENVEIIATPNGFVVIERREQCHGLPGKILAVFESRRSLLAWLGERLVPR